MFLQGFANKRYALFFKLPYHLFCKVSRAAHQTQNDWKIRTKVTEEDSQSGLNNNAAVMEVYFSLSIKPGVFVSPLNIMRISREPFHMEPYKLYKTWRFHKIISYFSPLSDLRNSRDMLWGLDARLVALEEKLTVESWQVSRTEQLESNWFSIQVQEIYPQLQILHLELLKPLTPTETLL